MPSLEDMTRQQQGKRAKPAKPIERPDDVERYYRAQLESLVRAMEKEVNKRVMPVIKKDEAEYTADDWSDDITTALDVAEATFATGAMQAAFLRLAREVVARTTASVTRGLVRSVERSVGVDIRPMLSERDMSDYIKASVQQNVDLIRSVPEHYFGRIRNTVYQSMMDRVPPSGIAEQIQADTGVSQRRAQLIAQDQTSKMYSQVTKRRQEQAGITHFKWVTSQDERVTGRPGGRYPNAKIKCYQIARKDVGNGPGVYSIKKGAEYGGEQRLFPGTAHVRCRCTQTPVFAWELDDTKK